MIDQKTGARDQAAEHLGMLDKIAAEEQELLGTRRALDGTCRRSAFHVGRTGPAPVGPAPVGGY